MIVNQLCFSLCNAAALSSKFGMKYTYHNFLGIIRDKLKTMNEISGRKAEGLSLANFMLYLYMLCIVLCSDGIYTERAERSFQGFGGCYPIF